MTAITDTAPCEHTHTQLVITPTYCYVECKDCGLQGPNVAKDRVPEDHTPASAALAGFHDKRKEQEQETPDG